MLINPDHVNYMNEEYERRLAAFRLERKLRKARAAARPQLGLVARWGRLLSSLTTLHWRRTGRGATAR